MGVGVRVGKGGIYRGVYSKEAAKPLLPKPPELAGAVRTRPPSRWRRLRARRQVAEEVAVPGEGLGLEGLGLGHG